MSSWESERKRLWAIVFELKRQVKSLKDEVQEKKGIKKEIENTEQTA